MDNPKLIISPELLQKGKLWIRQSGSDFEEEIEQTLMACLLDLSNVGIMQLDPADALIQQALKLYLKAQFGYDDDAEKFAKSYEYLKSSLSLSGEYNGRNVNG